MHSGAPSGPIKKTKKAEAAGKTGKASSVKPKTSKAKAPTKKEIEAAHKKLSTGTIGSFVHSGASSGMKDKKKAVKGAEKERRREKCQLRSL